MMHGETPRQNFDGPFYAERWELTHDDPLDTRPGGTKVGDDTLARLVTLSNRIDPLNRDVHAVALRNVERAVHEDLIQYPTTPSVLSRLRRAIFARVALRQEISKGVVELTAPEKKALAHRPGHDNLGGVHV